MQGVSELPIGRPYEQVQSEVEKSAFNWEQKPKPSVSVLNSPAETHLLQPRPLHPLRSPVHTVANALFVGLDMLPLELPWNTAVIFHGLDVLPVSISH